MATVAVQRPTPAGTPTAAAATSATVAANAIDFNNDSNNTNTKPKESFRNYTDSARQQVKITRTKKVEAFYRQQHSNMTYEFVESMETKYLGLNHFRMGIWSALEYLDTFIDDSDPDTELSQLQHGLQTAEAIRFKYPEDEAFQVVGLIHDLGKILSIAFGAPQWCTVGDTFIVGCQFSEKNIFHDSFAHNPDTNHPVYSTKFGLYQPHCGLNQVKMSWGHDEYLYQVCVRNGCTLPPEALYMIRFHSFYPWHTQGAYKHLTNDEDERMLQHVQRFNENDLYSKTKKKQDVEKLRPYYQGLVKKFFPEILNW